MPVATASTTTTNLASNPSEPATIPPVCVLGIDVSKAKLTCALLKKDQEAFVWRREVPNTTSGIECLLELTPEEAPWVMEPTGRYSLFVAQQAQLAGRQVLLAPNKQAKSYLNSLQTRAKTDEVDSRGLALFAATRPLTKALHPYPINPPNVEQINQLLTARRGIVEAMAALRQRKDQLPYACEALGQAIEGLNTQLKELDKQIETLSCSSFEEVKKLQAVPGIGPVTAAAVVSRLKSRNFSDSDKFVGYVGLDVKILQSGKRKGQRGLTKQGDAELRRLLFLCARSSIQAKGSPFRMQYERELAKGMSKTAAICAVARKITRLCWAMVHNGTEYNPERVYSQPLSSCPPLSDNNSPSDNSSPSDNNSPSD